MLFDGCVKLSNKHLIAIQGWAVHMETEAIQSIPSEVISTMKSIHTNTNKQTK